MNSFFAILAITIPGFSQCDTLIPTSTTGQIIKHSFYCLSYDENNEQAEWVYYVLTSGMLSGSTSRTDNFREDPKVSTGSASLADYKDSGYDHGHLVPACDMTFSQTAMSESFFMSNMSPQNPSFNRGIWKKLEGQVRDWAATEGEIHVVTGPINASLFGTIGSNQVTVPGHYYKVIYDPQKQTMIALVLPNEKGSAPLQSYTVTVDVVEFATGIDFFPQLDDNIEESLESKVNTSAWIWAISSNSTSSSSTSTANQCKGIIAVGLTGMGFMIESHRHVAKAGIILNENGIGLAIPIK